jgi:hypothetical protein
MIAAVNGMPVTTLTTIKASTPTRANAMSRSALRESRYTAQTSDTRENTRRKVLEAFTAGGKGYVSLAKTPASGRPIRTESRKAETVAGVDDHRQREVPLRAPRSEPFSLGVTQFHWDEHDRNFDWRIRLGTPSADVVHHGLGAL